MNKTFWSELKQRNVFKVAAAYLVVGWVVMQVVDTFAPALNLPEWINSAIALLILVGFPFAIILSWAYELTSQGIVKEKSKVTDIISLVIISSAFIGIIGYYYWQIDSTETVDQNPQQQIASEQVTDNSIAVLPFVDMSSEGNLEYLGDGITEEILNVLVKGREIRVAGRTSSFQFKGKNQDLRNIGESLGVQYILEGSVRSMANQVRVTAQLIKASDGFHVWSETYDRTLDNIFQLQDEIAASIASALEVSFDPATAKSNVSNKESALASEFYLKGVNATKLRGHAASYGVIMLEAALRESPDSARIWSALGFAYSKLGAYGFNRGNLRETRIERVYEAVKRARELDPNDATAMHLIANKLRGENKYKGAEEYYLKAIEQEPQSASIHEDYTEFLIDVGRFNEALDYGLKTYRLDPLTPVYIMAYVQALYAVGDLNKVQSYVSISLEQNKDHIATNIYKMFINFNKQDYQAAEAAYNTLYDIIPGVMKVSINKFITARKENTPIPPSSSYEYGLMDELIWFIYHERDDMEALTAYLDTQNLDFPFPSSLFKRYYDTQHMRKYVETTGLLEYWKATGNWPDMCRPKENDDYECSSKF